jgi:hypothetical protein
MKQTLKHFVFAVVLFVAASTAAAEQQEMTNATGSAAPASQPTWQTEQVEQQVQQSQPADNLVSDQPQTPAEQEKTVWTTVSPEVPLENNTTNSEQVQDSSGSQQQNTIPGEVQETTTVQSGTQGPNNRPNQEAVVVEPVPQPSPTEQPQQSTSSKQTEQIPPLFPSTPQQQNSTSPAVEQQAGQQPGSGWPVPSPPLQQNATTAPPASAQQMGTQMQVQNQNKNSISFSSVAAPQPKDDIIATIEEALRQYKNKDFAGAVSNLDYATHLIRQKKSELLKALLPQPFYGWQAKAPTSQSLGTAVFGGGSTVSRDYFTQNGSVISVEIVSDSPVLQSIIMMLNNPLFAGASGGNLKTIKRQRAMIKYNDEEHSGEINIVVASRFIVTVKGRGIDLTWLLRYAEAVDFDALAKN